MAGEEDPLLQGLRERRDDPEEQARYAVTLLRPRQRRVVLLAALDAVRRHPLAEARVPLLTLYAHLAAAPEKRDPAGYMRRPLLDALRGLAQPGDVSLLLSAAFTYERYPPDFVEEAGLVRAAGLVALDAIDQRLATYAAARLLLDLPHTDPMSGEPAATAARVLAAQGESVPLFAYAMLPLHLQASDVAAESLRQLTDLAEDLVPALLEHYGECDDPVRLIGLFDLLLGHRTGVQGSEFMVEFLARTEQLDLYRYLSTAIVAAGHEGLMDRLLESMRWERDGAKRELAAEVLELRASDPRVAAALVCLRDG